MATKNEQILKILDETQWYYDEMFPMLQKDAKKEKLDLYLVTEYLKGSMLIKHPLVKTFTIIEHYSNPKGPLDFFVFERAGKKLYGFLIEGQLVRYGNFTESAIKQFLLPKSSFLNKTMNELLTYYDILVSDIPRIHHSV